MPTYDYRCKACKREFEQFQSIKDKPLKKCPKCGKISLERLIGTGGAILFKGSGFYQTDYRGESYKKAAEADKPKAAAESKADSKPAESKPSAPAKPHEAKPHHEKKRSTKH
ncbi:hypothetical protein PHYC_00215 [Phycisphaerales bacterium]|nr:hypothetical protein PHYC_00215 [Phycisphaerales bacterium]